MVEVFELPREFKIKLTEPLRTYVNATLLRFSKLYKKQSLYFFPEYSDHSQIHINKVFEIASKIINRKAYSLLVSEDIGALIVSILAHDVGMHLCYSGFKRLLGIDYLVENPCREMTWSELWNEYLKEAKYWSSSKRYNILGIDTNDDYIIKDPMIKAESALDKRDRMFVGEFIRRYHHLLAYDFIYNGFPFNDNETIFFFRDNECSELCEPVALIASSHGLSAWDMVDLMKKRFPNTYRNHMNIKTVFLSLVLRLADYFDMLNDRLIPNGETVSSPISQKEQEKQRCVSYIDMDYCEDAESIYVYTKDPKDSSSYLDIQSLLVKQRNELDTCWAVIGKEYSQFTGLKALGLSFRRIYSNLETDQFASVLPFIPKTCKLLINSDVIPRLISPLYGNNPSYGIRELIQNAVDACLEKAYKVGDCFKGKVSIIIRENIDGSGSFTISDNGVGMSEAVLLNYYLSIGASTRNSDKWKNEYQRDGKPAIIRIGRFGVGVLAGFLLGNCLEVITTSMDDNIQYHLKMSYDCGDQINIERKHTLESSGTIIRIDNVCASDMRILHDQAYDSSISNDREVGWTKWYYGKDPILSITIPDTWESFIKERLVNDFSIAMYGPQHDCGFHTLTQIEVEHVAWAFIPQYNCFAIINGIVIPERYKIVDFKGFSFKLFPLLIIQDYDALIPLSLDRMRIDGQFPFINSLLCEMMKVQIVSTIFIRRIKWRIMSIINGVVCHSDSESDFALTNDGYIRINAYSLRRLKNRKIVLVNLEQAKENDLSYDFISSMKMSIPSSCCVWPRSMAHHDFFESKIVTPFFRIETSGYFQKEYFSRFGLDKPSESQSRRFSKEFNNKWVGVARTDDDYELMLNLVKSSKYAPKLIGGIYIANFIPVKEVDSHIAEVYDYYMGDNIIIPDKYEERDRIFTRALADLMDFYIDYDPEDPEDA